MTTEHSTGVETRPHDESAPDLPRLYELIRCDIVDSAVDEARRRALHGAEEGTLVWAQQQTAARDLFGRPRPSPRGHLYGCLILRPEHPAAVALQLNYVAVVSLGVAIAELASPMTELRYRWPNAVLLNNAKAGDVVLEPGPTLAGVFEWMLLGFTVNVINHPETSGPEETSLAAEGAGDVTAAELLDGFSRYFLSWINRWADDGFAPVRKAWRQRLDGLGETREIRLKEKMFTGRLVEFDEHGILILETEDGIRRLGVADYYGMQEAQAARS